MRATLRKAFDDCLERIKRGEAVDACLSRYPRLREQVSPLLFTALSIATVPRVAPSGEFRRQSKDRLLKRLLAMPARPRKSHQIGLSDLAMLWRGLEHAFTGRARVLVPLTLVFILGLQCLLLFGVLNPVSRSGSLLSTHGTLSILAGGVQLQVAGSSTWEDAKNGMTVGAGSRVKTAPDAQALLTFFNGTTVTLAPGTDLTVERAEAGGQKQPSNIVLKQWVGKTWSRVTKLVDPGSRYEIQTPSAVALVRGTLFVTEVDEKGSTTVQTIEGLVSVAGQGREVFVPAGQQTTVEAGAPPSAPVTSSASGTGGSAGQGGAGTSGQGTAPASTGGTGGAVGMGGAGTSGQSTAPSSPSGTERLMGQGGVATPAQGTGAVAAQGAVPGSQSEKAMGTGPSAEGTRPAETIGQSSGVKGAGESTRSGVPASPDNREPPHQDQDGVSWQDKYGIQAALLLFIVLYLVVLMVVGWRMH